MSPLNPLAYPLQVSHKNVSFSPLVFSLPLALTPALRCPLFNSILISNFVRINLVRCFLDMTLKSGLNFSWV